VSAVEQGASTAEPPAGSGEPRISMRDIRVTFDATVALAHETFEVWPGEIVGLLGHNGAGKSTLVNVATGAIRPDSGTMVIDGEPVSLSGRPAEMERRGIKVIHQDPALSGNLSIAENIALARPGERRSRGDRRRAAKEALARLGSSLDVDRPVETLDLGARQVVDMARSISGDVRCFFLDEPTGALGKYETDRLHALLRDLAADGKAIIYVSHRMRDIVEVCTRVVVLREGKVIMSRSTEGLTAQQLSAALSPGVELEHKSAAAAHADVTLEVEVGEQKLAFRKGEIAGLYGMAAGPQYELMASLFGLGERVDARLDGASFSPRAPRDAIRRGVFLVTADRERDALLPEMSALDNLVMPWVGRLTVRGAVSKSKSTSMYDRAKAAMDIRGATADAPISAFSGGNRQKHVLGRWLYGHSTMVLLLCQPTQGVDVGARADIATALRAVADEGVTVLVASSETDEIALLCDRTIVCEGETWPELEREADWEQRMLEKLLARTGLVAD
jgi:ABC-type sugar transport system ATPase subunit